MKKFSKVSILIIIFLAVSVLFPIFNMLVNVKWDNFSTLVSSTAFTSALKNSLFVGIISTITSIFIAYILAYGVNKVIKKHKNFYKILFTLPMLIPSISHGLGLINLFGTNGIISKVFGFDIIGSTGIIIGSVMYSFPIAFLMLDDGFNYIDDNMYYAAKVLGLNKWQTFKKVTLCYMKKPLLSAIFAVFTMVFTDYGVPLAVGGKFITLPVFLYKDVIGLLDFSKGTMIGLFLLIPAIISFIVDNFSKDYSSGDFNNCYDEEENKIKTILIKIFMFIVILFIFVVLGSFIYYAFVDNPALNNSLSLKHLEYVIGDNLAGYMLNSLLISIVTALLGTFISYMAAYFTARRKNFITKIIHILVIITLAIPGIVLGLAYSISFKNTPIYNTFIIIILVNIIHFIASPYLMAYNALLKLNQNYEVVAKTCNISIFRIIIDVIVPCSKTTILEMMSYFFINSMITISAVTFLFNTNTMPLSLLINTYEGNMMLGEAAIISIIILIFNLIAKIITNIFKTKEGRKNKYENIIY